MHAGRVRGVEFSDNVGNEKDFACSQTKHRRDPSIALQLLLRTNGRIEIIFDELGQIAGFGVSKKKFLGQRTAGREYVDA